MQAGKLLLMPKRLSDHLLAQIQDRATKIMGREPTPHALAKLLHLAPNTIHNWIRGTSPRLDKMERAAKYLDCQVWELLHPDPYGLEMDLQDLAAYRAIEKKRAARP